MRAVPASYAPPSEAGYALVVPVKRLAEAKSRLHGISPVQRQRLALAFALDTLNAASRSARVAKIVVVTDEGRVRRRCRRRRAWTVVLDPGAGLNAAISRGTEFVAIRYPSLPVAVLMADLPALVPEELDEALAEAGRHPFAFVADADGVGTTLFAARQAWSVATSFGNGSAARHVELGAVPITAPVPTLRRDVDTVHDVVSALALGTGPWTGALAAAWLDKPRVPASG
ncbi:MAG: 2-phospho-L-lactate guanylyltransferase [Actinomycetota bacterium]|nr:2-phospho-L-lactate guanylyltransferase [Actinomycetota bacterium]